MGTRMEVSTTNVGDGDTPSTTGHLWGGWDTGGVTVPPGATVSPPSFNQLDLPAYESYEKLRHMLLLAIQECSEGFGLA